MAAIFGTRLHRRHRGKLAGVIDRIAHGHHVYRAYFKNAFLKQYEKFATFLRKTEAQKYAEKVSGKVITYDEAVASVSS